MENNVMTIPSDAIDILVVTDVELLKQYTAIIRSWVWDTGEISDITARESILYFSHDGSMDSCPMELETVHRLRIEVANQIEERAAYV